MDGWKTCALKEKLKILKGRLKTWNKNVFGNLDSKILDLAAALNDSDEVASSRILGEEKSRMMRQITNELFQARMLRSNLLYQKSRVKWLQLGDANSAFFHSYINFQRRENNILAVLAGDSWVEGVVNVKNEVKRYFQVLYGDAGWCRTTLEGVAFKNLSSEDILFLEAPFSLEEVKQEVWSCDGEESRSRWLQLYFHQGVLVSLKRRNLFGSGRILSQVYFTKGCWFIFYSPCSKKGQSTKGFGL